MREIKFRAWDGLNMYFESTVHSTPYCLCINLTGELIDHAYSANEQRDDITLMQYTGLKDKNGKEIYEGDIIGTDDPEDPSKYIVEFIDGAFACTFIYDERKVKVWLHENLEFLKDINLVIGNIYENPELVK